MTVEIFLKKKAVVFMNFKKKVLSVIIFAIILAVISFNIIDYYQKNSEFKVIFIGFENNASVTVLAEKNGNISLFDCGDKYCFEELCQALSREKIYKINRIFLSSTTDEHTENLKELINIYNVEEIFLFENSFNFSDVVREKNVKVKFLKEKENIKSQNCKIETISAGTEEKNTLFKISAPNFSYLLFGSCPQEQQVELIAKYPDFFTNISVTTLPHTYEKDLSSEEMLKNFKSNKIIAFAKPKNYKNGDIKNIHFVVNCNYTIKP